MLHPNCGICTLWQTARIWCAMHCKKKIERYSSTNEKFRNIQVPNSLIDIGPSLHQFLSDGEERVFQENTQCTCKYTYNTSNEGIGLSTARLCAWQQSPPHEIHTAIYGHISGGKKSPHSTFPALPYQKYLKKASFLQSSIFSKSAGAMFYMSQDHTIHECQSCSLTKILLMCFITNKN